MEKIRVLIVEDDPSVNKMIKLTLGYEAPGISIETVGRGEDCLEYLEAHEVDCILSDYQLSGMNGMELLRRLREAGNMVPFIFLTGQGNEEVARAAFKSGAYDYFVKDAGFAHLPRIINSIEQAVRQRATELHRARVEKELLHEKNKLETILASIGDGISIQDREFTVLYQNRVHKDMVGDHAGKLCYEQYARSEDECEGCPVKACFDDGESHRLEKTFVRDGGTRSIEIFATPLKGPDGEVVAGIEAVRDITERKQAEKLLGHRLEVEKAVAMVSSVLAATEHADLNDVLGILGRAVSANRAYIFRFRDDGRLIDNTHEWCSAGTRPEIENLQGLESEKLPWFMRRMLNNENFVVQDVSDLPEEASAERAMFEEQDIKSLAIVPMYFAGRLMGFVGFDDTEGARDWSEDDIRLLRASSEILAAYTERIRAENALRQSEESLMEAQRIAHIGRWDLDLVTGKLDWSDDIYRIFEIDPAQFGASYEVFLERVHPEDREAVDTAYTGSVRGMKPYDLVHRLLMDDGRVKYVHERCETQYDGDGRPLRSIGTVQDITYRKRLEAIAESVNSMNNIGYVFSSVRHEIGGPLNAVRMTLELIENNIKEYKKKKIGDYVSRCLEELDGVEYLLRTLKSFNMYESPALTRTDMASFMDKFLTLLRTDFGKRGIVVSAESVGGGIFARVDPRALQQVLLNVMSNAADALEGVDGPMVRLNVSRSDGMAVISVQDNGRGMTDEQRGHLFKPFFTSKPGGTGLGLVIARRMLANMDATIDVDSRHAEGTMVEIVIPEDTGEDT